MFYGDYMLYIGSAHQFVCFQVSLEYSPRSPDFRRLVPNLRSPDVLGLKLTEAFTASWVGQDFRELSPKTLWDPRLGTTGS